MRAIKLKKWPCIRRVISIDWVLYDGYPRRLDQVLINGYHIRTAMMDQRFRRINLSHKICYYKFSVISVKVLPNVRGIFDHDMMSSFKVKEFVHGARSEMWDEYENQVSGVLVCDYYQRLRNRCGVHVTVSSDWQVCLKRYAWQRCAWSPHPQTVHGRRWPHKPPCLRNARRLSGVTLVKLAKSWLAICFHDKQVTLRILFFTCKEQFIGIIFFHSSMDLR